MLLPGEKILADQLLDITKTARKQEATIPEQGKILHEMGELYLKDAIETGNGEQFVKASALINASLVRTEDPSNPKILQRIVDTYKGVMRNIKGAALRFSMEELVAKVNRNKDALHAIRVETYEMCKGLEQLFESYDISDPTSVDIETKVLDQFLLVKSKLNPKIQAEKEILHAVKKVSLRVQKRMLEFVKSLLEQAIDMCEVSPPCSYAVIGLGSIARQEITPYSDLEFALLIETDSKENKQYFKNLVYLFHLLILDLGETPIPAIAIESLNDFLTPGGDKFYDIITPCGFRLDGAMPWACKTPIGRKKTPHKEPLDLIKTSENMAELLRGDNVLGQAYRVADILSKTIFICGDSDIYGQYISKSRIALSKINHKEKARRSLVEDYDRSPDWSVQRMGNYNLLSKQLFYRFPSAFVENLRLYFAPYYQSNSNMEVLDHLYETKVLSYEGFFNLKVNLAFCYGFRLLTYLKNRGQYESFDFMKTPERPFSKTREHNPLEARSKCRVAYFENKLVWRRMQLGCNGLRHTIDLSFKDVSTNEVKDLKQEVFIKEDDVVEYFPISWNRSKPMISNLEWARATKEVPSQGCGEACGIKRLVLFTREFWYDLPVSAKLKAWDDILDIKGCKCLQLLRTTLLVSKAILILRYDLEGDIPKETDISELLKMYEQERYKNIRERYYLLDDICELSMYTSDKSAMLSAIKLAEVFFKDIATFDEPQQTMVNMMKFSLVENLTFLYRLTGRFEKSIELCQRQIDNDEMILGIDSCHRRTGRLYINMGDTNLTHGLNPEALGCFEKGFKIHLNISENFRYSDGKGQTKIEDYIKEHHWKTIIRTTALKMARLYGEQQRREDALEVLTIAFTKDGKSFDIKSVEDKEALFLLCYLEFRLFIYWEKKFEKHLKNGSQYLEELLEIIRDEKGDLTLRKDLLKDIRLMAITTAEYYKNENRLEDAIKVLTKSMTKDGTSCDIETLEDMIAVRQLSLYCHELGHMYEHYLQKGNQYMEESIEIGIKLGQDQIHNPHSVLHLVDIISKWMVRLGYLEINKMLFKIPALRDLPRNDYTRSLEHPFVVAYVERKYYKKNSGNKTEEESLVETLCKLVESKELQRYFLESVDLIDYRHQELSYMPWTDFFFALCNFSVLPEFKIDYFLPSMITFRSSMLEQAEIFCEKVVKRVVPENIHKMCLLYITFQRLRMMHYDYKFTHDNEQLQSAFELSKATLVEFKQFFPDCHTAYKVTNLVELYQ